jgi:S1-C subfamily serine protease
MRRTPALLLALAGSACGAAEKPHAPVALTPAEIAHRSLPSVVRIQTDLARGTGFIIGADGRIATNLHVVEGARRVRVTLADEREFDQVTVSALDAGHDLVVLRIPATALPALRFYDGALEVGQPIVAIGHPVGMENTVSDGLVSGMRRVTADLELIQMTAPISPGSSGGPVLDDRGRVIGVATLQHRVGQNVNFAMPVRYLAAIAQERGNAPITSLPDNRTRRMFAGCSSAELVTVYLALSDARRVGEGLVREGRHREALDHYRLAAADLVVRVPGCASPRRTLVGAALLSERLASDVLKATEFRAYMDAILRDLRRALR